jgi:hypothetical protein
MSIGTQNRLRRTLHFTDTKNNENSQLYKTDFSLIGLVRFVCSHYFLTKQKNPSVERERFTCSLINQNKGLLFTLPCLRIKTKISRKNWFWFQEEFVKTTTLKPLWCRCLCNISSDLCNVKLIDEYLPSQASINETVPGKKPPWEISGHLQLKLP